MGDQNRRDDVPKVVATVALGAAVGYGCYKLFETFFSSNEPHQSNPTTSLNARMVQPRPISFQSSLPCSFPNNSKIYLIDSMDKCRYAMRELKSYAILISNFQFSLGI